ncbi:aromatic-ring-hydroxylating dioxygenase subunit beta [Nitratireductor kimnyeongensis]|uniref:Aromatic-ring-hydroxylating dioxygenase subunit beta n=1 Tax=Nitratireductor kimnyeongensis TaxID=430679 RepID=A0ABW0TBF3_9HYPH|nr:aromatic-ring-hydroxylating dioxygenase subunit beta [Nitratireductor kimnyeongensis]QZZ36758.1 aromatic-ring-hydroxylating dioxygenase subunit beta [Nitratireductor kimnyeongensis]
MTTPTRDDLIDFVYEEARMLDDGRFDEWLDLWTHDSYYWMPLDYNQEDAKHVTSLLHEDAFMRKLRVERFKGERTFSQKPKTRCHHVLNRPFIDHMDEEKGEYVTHTAFHYVETRLDDQILLAATARHELKLIEGKLKITHKRVDLLNSDAAFGNIQMFL